MFILVLALQYTQSSKKAQDQYSEFLAKFDQHQIGYYTLNLNRGSLEYWLMDDLAYNEKDEKWEPKKDAKGNIVKGEKFTVPYVDQFLKDVNEEVRAYNKEHPEQPITYNFINGSGGAWLVEIVPMVLIGGMVLVFVLVMMRKMNQNIASENNRTLNFGKARIKQVKDEKRKTTFADVAGADEEKAELSEIVEFLKDPHRFSELGARIPKGVLLVGAPGTGKTLLARAVAGEADVPFFSISGSDFVEMYVGVGASRVRDLFDQAKKHAPSIVFIDEIDAVGRQRGAGMGGGHDEREQTLNQLLVEMDGFGANEGVIIIAATNRPDILDPALLRPGRFDRQITVLLPDLRGREAILRVHAKNKPLAPDVDLQVIARTTAGFTGADLENLLNEAALLAARGSKRAITKVEIEDAMLKVVIGTEKKSHKKTEKDLRVTAYHEAGHALATYHLASQDAVHQISIISRGMAAGFTMHLPEDDKEFLCRGDMLDSIVVLLGGRVAEALVLSDISTGASNDIERATKLARDMVTRYGMSRDLGPVSYASDHDAVFLGRDFSQTRSYSENTAKQIDEEIKGIVSDSYRRTEDILNTHMDQLHAVAKGLLAVETMTREQFETILRGEALPELTDPAHEETKEPSELS
ncbi:MAG: ATP-dependent zinc metalloprotease FtsH [Oscillospiraceae bacterium]|nr:ATP-dependent zinc metalloprotease FtsH [Oscillospiraceae bacterium]